MKISLIVAVYNRDDCILRALNSIKSQTYKDIEIVVIDGASSDNTIEIAKSVLSENDIFISEKDSGIYDALNKGIKNSSGDIIGFLHSDDLYYDNNVISKIQDFFYKDSSLDIVFGNATFFKKGMTNKIIRNYQSDNLSIKNLAWGKMPAHTAMFFKKKLFQNYGMFNIRYEICPLEPSPLPRARARPQAARRPSATRIVRVVFSERWRIPPRLAPWPVPTALTLAAEL